MAIFGNRRGSTTPTDESVVTDQQHAAQKSAEAPFAAFIDEILPLIDELCPLAVAELRAHDYPNAQLVRIERGRKSTQVMSWPIASNSGVSILKDGSFVSNSNPATPFTLHPPLNEAGRYQAEATARSLITLLPVADRDAWNTRIDDIAKRHFPP